MKTIVVTGAAGFVGKAVSQHLTQLGYVVIRCGRKKSQDIDRVWDISQGPLLHPPAAWAIIHCAASVDDWAQRDVLEATNIKGTKHVLETFMDVPLFIYISSASVYDYISTQKVFTESDATGKEFLNGYSETKWLGESIVRENASSLRRVILRPHIVYGPGDNTIAPRLKQSVCFGKFVALGDGTNRVSLTHIHNLVQAIQKLLEITPTKGVSIYNVSDAETPTIRRVLEVFKRMENIDEPLFFVSARLAWSIAVLSEYLFRLFGSKRAPFITKYVVAHMTREHTLNIQKIRDEIGYRPVRSFIRDYAPAE